VYLARAGMPLPQRAQHSATRPVGTSGWHERHASPGNARRNNRMDNRPGRNRTCNPRFWSLRTHAYTGTHQSTMVAETATYDEPVVDGCDYPRIRFGHSLDTHSLRLNPHETACSSAL